MGLKREDWVWMPHPAHLIVGNECRFRLATYVGGYIVSTVGEWLPGESVREIMAQSRGITLEGIGDAREYDFMRKIGFMEIGLDRTYETMVFPAKTRSDVSRRCCPWECVHDKGEVDFDGYQDAVNAYRGHMIRCEKWSKENTDAP